MDAMNVQEAIKKAVSTAAAYGYAVPEAVMRSIEGLNNPVYRVAVVGKFQVGKSTLINRVFLGENSILPGLSEGNGFHCETAVATDVEYGETPKLEIYNWEETGGERLAVSKENPTGEDVKSATVCASEGKRTELAENVSRVRLVVPNESLKGYTILDTPGLDDPNQELLMNTTYRVIPGSDVALLVVEPKRLDQVAVGLLRNDLIGKGVSRLMVLVSYNPKRYGYLDDEDRAQVVKVIKEQLAGIGRIDIPVEMYCFDSAVEDITNDASELRLLIRTFLNENALPGRVERVAFEVRQYLEGVELELAAKIRALGSSEAEKTALKMKVEAQISDFKAQCERSFRRLQDEMDTLKVEASQDVGRRVHKVFSNFREKLELARDVSEIRKHFDHAESSLKDDIMVEVNAVGLTIKSEVGRILERYNEGFSDVFSAWNGFLCDDLDVKRPFLAKVPPIIWDLIFVLVWDWILPLGTLTAILGHAVGKKTFGIDPNVVLTPIIRAQASGKIVEVEEMARTQIADQLRANVESAFLKVKEGVEDYNRSQVERMRKAICDDVVSSDREALVKTKAAISDAIDTLR